MHHRRRARASSSRLPAIEVISHPSEGRAEAGVEAAFARIAQECTDPTIDVLVVGRYNFCLEGVRGASVGDDRIKPRHMTVHAAKGLEADYCIVIDVVGGRYGFPTEITDDPLLELVLAQRNSMANAEERRLFYVALTRARRKAFVVTRDVERSVFVDELEGPEYAGLVIASGAKSRTVTCAKCKGGRYVRRSGPYGQFWSCSNFPQCKSAALVCPKCGARGLARSESGYECAAEGCQFTAPKCPKCGVGAVVERHGRFGKFYGCTEWRIEGPSCDHTTDARRAYRRRRQ